MDWDDPDLEPSPWDYAPRVRPLWDLRHMRHRVRNEAENDADRIHYAALLARPTVTVPRVEGWQCGQPHCTKCVSPNQRKKPATPMSQATNQTHTTEKREACIR